MDGEPMVLTSNVKGFRLGFSDWPTISRIDGRVHMFLGLIPRTPLKRFPFKWRRFPIETYCGSVMGMSPGAGRQLRYISVQWVVSMWNASPFCINKYMCLDVFLATNQTDAAKTLNLFFVFICTIVPVSFCTIADLLRLLLSTSIWFIHVPPSMQGRSASNYWYTFVLPKKSRALAALHKEMIHLLAKGQMATPLVSSTHNHRSVCWRIFLHLMGGQNNLYS